MRKTILLVLFVLVFFVTSTSYSQLVPELSPEHNMLSQAHSVINKIISIVTTKFNSPSPVVESPIEIKEMIKKEAGTLNPVVIDKVLTTLKCAKEYHVESNNILAVIDYSLPSSEKRLWVFDLKEKKLLFHTYVAHGIKSGELLSTYFSNKHDSKASSMGVYKTEKIYQGRHGLSLQLDGLDRGFNDNASSRAVVMHGGWYVEERFIKKYGRPGRSWGCPAVPSNLTEAIINTIKDNSIFVMYYPNDNWLTSSKFQTCDILPPLKKAEIVASEIKPFDVGGLRDDILFADLNKHSRREGSEAVVAMTADNYERIFHTKAPLTRMLRRQINTVEYIALSDTELQTLATDNKDALKDVYFVIPVVSMVRGYYATEMKIVNLGVITDVTFNTNLSKKGNKSTYLTVHFETSPVVSLRSTNQFIRWLGL
jgi:hypothetical protein